MSLPSSPITTRPHLTHFTADFVQPPTALYIDRDDILLVVSWGSARSQPITIKGRLLTPQGEIQRIHIDHTPLTDRSSNYEYHAMAEGCLLGLSVTPTLTPIAHGDCYVEVSILRGGLAGFERTQTLISDYVSNLWTPTFPHSRPRHSLEGRGRIYTLTGTNPAPNTYVSETVPTNARWRLLMMSVSFNSSAVAGNRYVFIEFDSGAAGVTYWRNYCQSAHAASRVRPYRIAHFGTEPAAHQNEMKINIPPLVDLPSGHRIQLYADNAQLGDDFGAPHLLVEEWFD